MEPIFLSNLSGTELRELLKETIAEALKESSGYLRTTGNEDEIFTIEQAAEFLHLSVPTIYGKVSLRELPHYKKGKRLFFSRLDLVVWLKAGKRMTGEEISKAADEFMLKKRKRNN